MGQFTWNTIDEEQPAERRAIWRNPLTDEEHFGVCAAAAGERQRVRLDGDDGEWGSRAKRRCCSRVATRCASCALRTTRRTCTCGCASTPRRTGSGSCSVGLEPLPENARAAIEAFDLEGRSLGAAAPGYGWEPWQSVTWHERRKAGRDTLRTAFDEAVR